MWGAIIGGALSLGSQWLGNRAASKAANQATERTKQLLSDNQNWYDRRYNEDVTARADAQQVMNRLQEAIRKRNQAAEGKAAMMGGTGAALAAEKAANAAALANAAGQIAAQGAARKDSIEQQYLNAKSTITGQLNNIDQQRAANIAAATSAAASALGNAGNSVDDYLDGINKGDSPKQKTD